MERDSIVFYKEWWEAIESLPEEKRLEAISAVMGYAFSGTEPTDTMLRFATAQIRMFIDRDRKRYEEVCEKRREYARRGGLAKAAKSKQELANGSIRQQELANAAYNDNDNDNDNENKNENKNDNDTIKINLYDGSSNNARRRDPADYDDSRLIVEFFAPEKQATLEALAMQLSLSFDEMKQMALEVVNEWTLTGQTHPSYNDASRHLISVLRKKKRWGKPTSDAQAANTGLGVGEFLDSYGRRTYGTGGVIVPESAPPRPSAAHWWSDASRLWEKQI